MAEAEEKAEPQRLVSVCRKQRIPVNAVVQPAQCDFLFFALISTARLCGGVSTGGASPTAAIELRERISKQIPSDIEEMLLWMISVRRQYTRWGCRRENKKDCTSGICHRRDADRQRTGEDDGLHGCIKKRIRKRTCFSAVFQGCDRYACSKGSSAI